MEDLISVIMPAFNAESTIKEAIDSVCSQTYRALELIVIDDASQDQTSYVAECQATQDGRIRLLRHEKNAGVSLSRCEGAQFARGAWLAFLDSDDLWLPEKLEKQIALRDRTDAKLLFTASGFIKEDGKPLDYVLHVPEMIGYRKLLKQNLISNSSVLIQGELYERCSTLGDDMHEDYACWLNVLKEGRTAYGIDEPLMIYRLSPGSKSSDKLEAAKMNWRTYRAVGLNVFRAFYYMAWYTINGILKYKNLQY